MEFKRYYLPLRRWWWLLVVAALIAAVSSYIATFNQPPIYQSLTTLMIGQVIADPNPSTAEFNLGQQLAENYAEIANREPVRLATMQALGLPRLPDYRATALPNGQFIEIVVTDTNPRKAQAVADELANQLILRSPTGDPSDEQERLAFIQEQLDNLQIQITETEDEIVRLREALGDMDSAREIADAQSAITASETKLSDLQGIYSDLLANTQSGATNTISVIEPAFLPTRPIGPDKVLTILLAAAVGLSLAVAAAYILDYIDDTIKSPEDTEELTKAPIIGYLSELDVEDVGLLYVAENPRHPSVEEIRALRTNLEFAGVDQPLNTLLVSSADMDVGKTSVAANLAVVMSQTEKNVILIDADLRRPNVHNFFGMPNNYGLSDIFRGKLDIDEVLKKWPGGSVSIITAGDPPPNPAELLGSKKMKHILEALEQRADIVIIDGPPFIVADAPVLASKVNGVLLIMRIGHTRVPATRSMMEQIDRSGAKVIGVALNRIPPKRVGDYTGKQYYSSYYSNETEDNRDIKQRGGLRERLSAMSWRQNPNTRSGSSNKRVFDDIDVAEGDSEGFSWRE
jgi:succinoglycan biosynthesis transport protein ExoP